MTTDPEVREINKEVIVENREDTLSHREEYVENALRFLKFVSCIIAVLLFGVLLQSFQTEDETEKIQTAAQVAEVASIRAEKTSIESRDAAVVTRDELRAVVSELETAREAEPDLQNQAIIDALAAIARIEARMCGGPCA